MRYLVLASIAIFIFSCTPKVVKETPPQVEQPDIKYLWVYKKTINVRTDNSATSAKLASLADGDSVKVLQNENGWYEVIIDNGTKGWIRSDLLGTKSMSSFSKAIAFSNNLKEDKRINLFFDKKIQHKRIFLEFPKENYSSKKYIENKAREIGKEYQDTVYPGKITIQVIEPEKQSEYLTINLIGTPNADLVLPIIKYGILDDVVVEKNTKLKIIISINKIIENASLLDEARKIAGSFPISFASVIINFIDKKDKCILSFLEDASGEDYKFNQCL